MANIINNNFNFYKLKPYRGEYWDLTLNKDMNQPSQQNSNNMFDKNLVAYFDFSDKSAYDGIFINSLGDYKWEKAYSTDYVLENIGYTGFDNGLLYFERDKILDEDFPPLYSESTYEIKKEENKLKLHFITGSTMQYSYDYKIEEGSIKLNGGFLQGFFKTECNKYEVLPSSFKHNDSITFEFDLKPVEFNKEHYPRMNDLYPNNKGMFFYIGTRSENKWIYLYDKLENELYYADYITYDDETIQPPINFVDKCNCFGDDYLDIEDDYACDYDYVEDELDISDFIYQTSDNVLTIGKYEEYVDYNNPFLLFNRTCDGFNIKTKNEKSFIRYVGLRTDIKKEGNLFLLMNRTKSGHTTNSLEKLYEESVEKYNIYADLYENALGFRITDKGEIGYRYLIKNDNFDNKMEVIEAYSKENIVKHNEWNHIVVKMNFIYDTMVLKFYVNENLVFISRFLPKLNLRKLDDLYEKQETVPFNISVGGGTQGLIDTILPNYNLKPFYIYPLETYFGGSFIGYLKFFKIYINEKKYD